MKNLNAIVLFTEI